MWLFTPFGFFSVVAHRDLSDYLLVRARARADIEALAADLDPRPRIFETPRGDYRFRAPVPRRQFAELVRRFTQEIDYGNFKTEVACRQGVERADLYHRIWRECVQLQQRAESDRRRVRRPPALF